MTYEPAGSLATACIHASNYTLQDLQNALVDSRAEIPEPQCVIPRPGQSKLSITTDHNVRHKMIVPFQRFLCYPVVSIFSCQTPHYYCFICYRTKWHLQALNLQDCWPLEADKIMSGTAGVVAIWVTQPPCPFRVLLKRSCSVIFARLQPICTTTQSATLTLAKKRTLLGMRSEFGLTVCNNWTPYLNYYF